MESLPKMDRKETEKAQETDREATEKISVNLSLNHVASELASKEPETQSTNLSNQLNDSPVSLELSYQSLKRIKIQKNTVAKLTLSIRRATERFLYDEMQRIDSPEERLTFLSEYITSIQEKTYELREIELASCKVKENVLQEIDKLNLIDMKKYRKTNQEDSPEITTTKLQDKEDTRFAKDIQKFRKLNMSDDIILNIIKKLGCSEERGKRLLSEVK